MNTFSLAANILKQQICTSTEASESSCEEISSSVGTKTERVVAIAVPDTRHLNKIEWFSQKFTDVVETLIEYKRAAQWKLSFVSVILHIGCS